MTKKMASSTFVAQLLERKKQLDRAHAEFNVCICA
jgi:hypothetical protein